MKCSVYLSLITSSGDIGGDLNHLSCGKESLTQLTSTDITKCLLIARVINKVTSKLKQSENITSTGGLAYIQPHYCTVIRNNNPLSSSIVNNVPCTWVCKLGRRPFQTLQSTALFGF